MTLRLLGNRILIEPVTEETASGFIIPEAYRSFRTGIVKAVGNGARIKNGERRPIPLEVGQSVVLSDDYRMPIDIDGVQHFLINDEKVLCILEKNPDFGENEWEKMTATEKDDYIGIIPRD